LDVIRKSTVYRTVVIAAAVGLEVFA